MYYMLYRQQWRSGSFDTGVARSHLAPTERRKEPGYEVDLAPPLY